MDPSVDFAARSTYDTAYRGTGNWPFNTAFAHIHAETTGKQVEKAGFEPFDASGLDLAPDLALTNAQPRDLGRRLLDLARIARDRVAERHRRRSQH